MNRKYILYLLLVIFAAVINNGCKLTDDAFTDPSENQTEIPISVAKWFNDLPSAISLTDDDGSIYGNNNQTVQQLILKNKLQMDYEFVTDQLSADTAKLNYMRNFILPNGNNFNFFGHGHKHVNHDKYTYNEALASFKLCYHIMDSMGLKPVAYAYPGGFGYLFRTRRALKESGFLCGRRFEQLDAADPYIMPNSTYEPKDWFGLPSLVMQSFNYNGNEASINNTEELLPYLRNTIQKKAWLILAYHAIGLKGAFGFYEMPDFERDLAAIKSFNFWCASMNDVTLYCYERNRAKATAYIKKNEDDITESISIKLSDNLPNDYYNQPLTVKFEIPESFIGRKLSLTKNGKEINTYIFDTQKVKISITPDESTYILKVQ